MSDKQEQPFEEILSKASEETMGELFGQMQKEATLVLSQYMRKRLGDRLNGVVLRGLRMPEKELVKLDAMSDDELYAMAMTLKEEVVEVPETGVTIRKKLVDYVVQHQPTKFESFEEAYHNEKQKQRQEDRAFLKVSRDITDSLLAGNDRASSDCVFDEKDPVLDKINHVIRVTKPDNDPSSIVLFFVDYVGQDGKIKQEVFRYALAHEMPPELKNVISNFHSLKHGTFDLASSRKFFKESVKKLYDSVNVTFKDEDLEEKGTNENA